MRYVRAVYITAILFFVAMGAYFVEHNIAKPRILILHSYLDNYSWTRGINTGLRRVLVDESAYTVRWHYMDTKRHAGEDFKRRAGITARKVIDEWKPNVIIAIDDDAQKFVAKYYVNVPNMSIVHAGINGEIDKYGYDSAGNVTGILERKPLKALKEAMIDLAKVQGKQARGLRVTNLGDRSAGLVTDEKFILEYDWAPMKLADSRLVDTFEEWQQIVLGADERTDFFIISNYRKLVAKPGDKKLMNPKEVMGWTEKNSPVPIVGMQGFVVEDGAAFAVGVSSIEQGEVAARKAVEIVINNRKASSIATDQTRQFEIYMSESRLKARGLWPPKIYEAFAKASDTYWQ